jgi:hypothetical protein
VLDRTQGAVGRVSIVMIAATSRSATSGRKAPLTENGVSPATRMAAV